MNAHKIMLAEEWASGTRVAESEAKLAFDFPHLLGPSKNQKFPSFEGF
jgi:hypothetical protein